VKMSRWVIRSCFQQHKLKNKQQATSSAKEKNAIQKISVAMTASFVQ